MQCLTSYSPSSYACNDNAPMSGTRERVSPTAPTVEMAAVCPPSSPVRRLPVERLSPLRGRPSTQEEESSVLMNTRDPRSTRYCYVAPRSGKRAVSL